MSPRRYDPNVAEYKREQHFNTNLFENLLPRFDAKYRKNLQDDLMTDGTHINKIYEKISTKVPADKRSDSHLITFYTSSNRPVDSQHFFDIRLPMPIFTYIPTEFQILRQNISNKPFLDYSGKVGKPGWIQNLPCYMLDLNRVPLSLVSSSSSIPFIENIRSGIYRKHVHKGGKIAVYSSPNFLRFGGTNPSSTLDDYSKEIIDKCFQYAYWNLPSPLSEKTSRLDNFIFHGSNDIFYHNVVKFNKTLIRIISISEHYDTAKVLHNNLKFCHAKVSMLVDDGDKIYSEVRNVMLTKTIADSFKENEIFSGLILSQKIKNPRYVLVFGSLGKKIESGDLTSLFSIVMQKELQYLDETSSVTFVDKSNTILENTLKLIKDNSNANDVFNSSFKSNNDLKNNLKNSITELFPLYINDDENIHQLSTSVISYLLSHNSENLKNKKIISSIIKILNTAKINSNDWSNDTKSQLKISNRGTNPLTGNPLTLFMESAPKLVHLMVCSRIFSQKF